MLSTNSCHVKAPVQNAIPKVTKQKKASRNTTRLIPSVRNQISKDSIAMDASRMTFVDMLAVCFS